MKLIKYLVILVLLPVMATAESFVIDELTADTMTINADALWDAAVDSISSYTGHGLYATGRATGHGITIPGPWRSTGPDTTTHFIVEVDSVLKRHDIKCDTTLRAHKLGVIMPGEDTAMDVYYTFDRLICDTFYVFVPDTLWCPYIDIKLDSTQYKKLMDWLE